MVAASSSPSLFPPVSLPSVVAPQDSLSQRVSAFFQALIQPGEVNMYAGTSLAFVSSGVALYQIAKNGYSAATAVHYKAYYAVKNYLLDMLQQCIQLAACLTSNVQFYLLMARKVVTTTAGIAAPFSSALGLIVMTWGIVKESLLLRQTRIHLQECRAALDQNLHLPIVNKEALKQLIDTFSEELKQRQEMVEKTLSALPAGMRAKGRVFLEKHYRDANFKRLYGAHGYQFLAKMSQVSHRESISIEEISQMRYVQTALRNKARAHWLNIAAAVLGLAAVIFSFAVPVLGQIAFVSYACWLAWLVCWSGDQVCRVLEKRTFAKEDAFYSQVSPEEQIKRQRLIEKICNLLPASKLEIEYTLFDPDAFAALKKTIVERLHVDKKVKQEIASIDAYFDEALKEKWKMQEMREETTHAHAGVV